MTPLSILFTAFFLLVQHLFARKRRAILKEEQELQGKMYDAMKELRSARHDASLEIALQRAKQATHSSVSMSCIRSLIEVRRRDG